MTSTPAHQERRRIVAFLVFCVCAYLLSASGRIVFPDDEIVFQTSEALVERGSLDIEGIPRRTGEPKGRPNGTFGWAPGPDGARYGFFGHGLSVVAMPMVVAGGHAAEHAPPQWKHAIRSDHFFVHRRSQRADWTRLIVSLTNCLLTPLATLLLVTWVRRLGYTAGTALVVGAAYGLGTLAWPYTRTFLSEPLSTIALVGAALCVTIHHQRRAEASPAAARWLYAAAAIMGLSVHVHLLNIVAVPAFVGYALAPAWSQRHDMARTWAIALLLGALGLASLGWSQYLRFGSPFESGRFGYYSHFVVPGLELLALFFSPGRSLWLTSPILLGALVGWRALWRRVPAVAWFSAAVVLTRLVFVAARSDWWGGWAIGPRFLLPVVPFTLLPLAAAWEHGSRRRRLGLAVLLAASIALQAHLAQHSIFEWMVTLHGSTPDDPGYLWVSHWTLRGSPAWGFVAQKPDLLLNGARRLAAVGYPGLWRIFLAVGVGAVSSLAALLWWSRTPRLRQAAGAGDSPRDEQQA
ncbi:MAG: DUF2723 domain-containing protein [Myxococcota bacterium]